MMIYSYASDPANNVIIIHFMSIHDNHTLFDISYLQLPGDGPWQRVVYGPLKANASVSRIGVGCRL